MSLPTIYVMANVAGSGVTQPGLSGGDRIMIECVKRWALNGVKVKLFVNESGYIMFERYLQRKDMKNIEIKMTIPTIFKRRPPLIKDIVYELFLLFRSSITALTIKPDVKNLVVYSASDFWADSIAALIMKLKNREIKWVASFYLFVPNPLNEKSPYKGVRRVRGLLHYLSQRPIYRLIRKYADMVWVTNEIDRWDFIDNVRLTPANVIAVRGGVDTRTPSLIIEKKEKKFEAVFIGRFHPQKGVLELIDIWKLICHRKPSAKLAMIGEGILEKEVKKKIREYRLGNNVSFFGFKDGIEKLEIFRDSKVVVHPAIYDSGGMAPCEAMACGLASVSFDLPALRTYYPKGMLKVPCYDLRAFAENILRLLSDEELYRKTAEDALEWAKGWDWDKRAQELLKRITALFDDDSRRFR